MQRRPNFQTVAWFNDLRQRGTLDMNPPYQRRSVWNQTFKDYFIETVLLGLPAPAIFLYQDISPDGHTVQHVVDGKQRLTALFEFIDGRFPVAEDSKVEQYRGRYFISLPDPIKKEFWSYILLVEYVPSDQDEVITGIFDRINRNTAKLTPQELRHARFSGEFISTAENLSTWLESTLGAAFPRIVTTSRKQMKDVELVSYLLLLTEEGTRGYSQDDLDAAYAARDAEWDRKIEIEDEFRATIVNIKELLSQDGDGTELETSRLRNQTDFYSLYGAMLELRREKALPPAKETVARIVAFVRELAKEDEPHNKSVSAYLDAARSASNDKGPREIRIGVIKKVILGLPLE